MLCWFSKINNENLAPYSRFLMLMSFWINISNINTVSSLFHAIKTLDLVEEIPAIHWGERGNISNTSKEKKRQPISAMILIFQWDVQWFVLPCKRVKYLKEFLDFVKLSVRFSLFIDIDMKGEILWNFQEAQLWKCQSAFLNFVELRLYQSIFKEFYWDYSLHPSHSNLVIIIKSEFTQRLII